MNVLALPRDEFEATARELEAQGMDTTSLRRQYREASSSFSGVHEYAKSQQDRIANEGRTSIAGGLLSKPEGSTGMDAIRGLGFEPQAFVAGLLDAAARGVDAPRAASQGLIPAQDMIGEALGTAGVAMGGGGAAVAPKGAIGSNALRRQITTEPEFRPETFYHGTRSDIDAFDPDMVDLGVHVGTVGQANQRLSHLIRRDDPTYTGPFDTFENIKGQRETSAFRTGAGPAENSQILPLRVRADYPLRMPDAGEWDRSEVVMYNIEKMLEDKNADPRLVEAFEDFDFDGLDDARAEYYDNTDWKGSYENREFLDDIKGRIKDAGYDSIVYKNMVESSGAEGVQDSMIVLDPQNIRSVNAKFDPSREYSSDLLAANASKSAGLLGAAAGGAVARPAGSVGMGGFEDYLSRVNPNARRVADEDRPNLMMGDMYGMLPRGSEVIGERGDTTFFRSSDGNYYATAYNPDVGEQDVVGYIMGRGDGTELQVVDEMKGQGIGGELQYLFRSENPDAPTGGLTEAGERSLERTYDRLFDEGIVSANASPAAGLLGVQANDEQDILSYLRSRGLRNGL